MKLVRLVAAALITTVVMSAPSYAGTVNVLWYTGGTEESGAGTYEAAVNTLVGQALSASGNTWHVTFWTGGAVPAGSYNVLVAASSEGPWSTGPNYASLNTAVANHTVSFGDRVMVTGQDADWHYMNYPGPSSFNGPQGFLIDSINWAGSGTGMGLVDLATFDEAALGLTGLGTQEGATNTVDIPSAYASYPINTGLTSAGLSNWDTSAHEDYIGADTSKWTGINTDGGSGFVTLVSAATAGGGTGGAAPEPASLTLLVMGALGFGGYTLRRRKLAQKAG